MEIEAFWTTRSEYIPRSLNHEVLNGTATDGARLAAILEDDHSSARRARGAASNRDDQGQRSTFSHAKGGQSGFELVHVRA